MCVNRIFEQDSFKLLPLLEEVDSSRSISFLGSVELIG